MSQLQPELSLMKASLLSLIVVLAVLASWPETPDETAVEVAQVSEPAT